MDKQLGKRNVRESSRPRMAYPPRPPCEPFKFSPIVELIDTPLRQEFYIAEEFDEKKNKLYEMNIELNNQYEEKIRNFFQYLVDKID
jgi:hypothetical protein